MYDPFDIHSRQVTRIDASEVETAVRNILIQVSNYSTCLYIFIPLVLFFNTISFPNRVLVQVRIVKKKLNRSNHRQRYEQRIALLCPQKSSCALGRNKKLEEIFSPSFFFLPLRLCLRLVDCRWTPCTHTAPPTPPPPVIRVTKTKKHWRVKRKLWVNSHSLGFATCMILLFFSQNDIFSPSNRVLVQVRMVNKVEKKLDRSSRRQRYEQLSGEKSMRPPRERRKLDHNFPLLFSSLSDSTCVWWTVDGLPVHTQPQLQLLRW